MNTTVSYPKSFLLRPQDRALVSELTAAGVSAPEAKLMLFLVWMDFSTGDSDRRIIGTASSSSIGVFEDFVGWKGERGGFVEMAVSAGFLRSDPVDGGGFVLICDGFRDANRGKAGSMQRRGGIARTLKFQMVDAANEAGKRDELWSRTGAVFEDIPREKRKDALVLIHRVCKALGFAIPSDSVLGDGTLHRAVRILEQHSEKDIDNTLIWLFENRSSGELPSSLPEIIRGWDSYFKTSKDA